MRQAARCVSHLDTSDCLNAEGKGESPLLPQKNQHSGKDFNTSVTAFSIKKHPEHSYAMYDLFTFLPAALPLKLLHFYLFYKYV